MASQRKGFWVVSGLALAGAGALAITAPRDNTRFVSAHAPTRHAAASRPAPGSADTRPAEDSASGEDAAIADAAAVENAGRSAAGAAAPAGAVDPAARAGATPEAARTGGAVGTAAAAPAAGTPIPQGASGSPRIPVAALAPRDGAAASRNLFRPLVTQVKTGSGLPPAFLPPLPGDMVGLMPLPDARATGGETRQRAYWEYVGTVQLDGKTFALIEEKKSKAGVYLREGDGFRGGLVRAIRPGYVIMSLAGKDYTLPKASGLSEEPAQRAAPANAPAPVAAAGQPAPGQPAPGQNAPWAAPGTPGAPGGPPVPGAMPDGNMPPPAFSPDGGGQPSGGWSGRRRRRWSDQGGQQ